MLFIKSVFNAIFSERQKTVLRSKFKRYFLIQDKKLYRKTYLKMFNYILDNRISRKTDYSYRSDEFLKIVKDEYVRELLLDDKETISNEELKICCDYLREGGAVSPFLYPNIDYARYKEEDIYFDESCGLYWLKYRGKRLYFKKNIESKEEVAQMMNLLDAEQQENSPHRYLTASFDVEEGDVIFDVGCAEGNFSLDIIERVKEVYLFETDIDWIYALEQTFKDYKDKIHIIPRYVSNKDSIDENTVTLETICRHFNIEKIGLLKMDVEGAECKVLEGAAELINKKAIKKIAVCTYHNADDEINIKQLLAKQYEYEESEGYMQVADRNEVWDIKKPYFLHALIRAKVKVGEN